MKRKSSNQKGSPSPKKKPNIVENNIEEDAAETEVTPAQAPPQQTKSKKNRRNKKKNKKLNKPSENTAETSNIVTESKNITNKGKQNKKNKNKAKLVAEKVEADMTEIVSENNSESEEEEKDDLVSSTKDDDSVETTENKTDVESTDTKSDVDDKDKDDKTVSKKVTKPAVKKIRYVLFIGNLSYNVTKKDIQDHFEKVGTIKDIRIPLEKKSTKQKVIAFIEVSNAEEYEKTLSLHGTFINGRKINVLYSTGKGGNKPDKHSKKKLLKMEAMRKKGMIAGFKERDNTRKRAKQRNKKKAANSKPAQDTA